MTTSASAVHDLKSPETTCRLKFIVQEPEIRVLGFADNGMVNGAPCSRAVSCAEPLGQPKLQATGQLNVCKRSNV